MATLLVEEIIAASRQDLYRLAQDYKHRLEWDSYATRIRYDHGAVTSLTGLVGAANFINPFRITVEHISLLWPSMFVTNMRKGPFFFAKLSGNWRFEPLEDKLTKVVLYYSFRSRWPVLNVVIDPLLARILKRDSRRALRDMKHAAENTDLLKRIAW